KFSFSVPTDILEGQHDKSCRTRGWDRLAHRSGSHRCRGWFVESDAEYADRAGDVLDLMLAEVLEGERQPIADLVSDSAANIYPVRLRQALHACGDSYAITIDAVSIGDHIA